MASQNVLARLLLVLGLFPQQLLYLFSLQREATTLFPTSGNKFSMSYSLSCCAWEPSPRPVPWLHSYLSSQVVPICTQTLLVLTFALEPYPVIVLGLFLITLTAQNLGFGVTHLQKGPREPWTSLELPGLHQTRLGASFSPTQFSAINRPPRENKYTHPGATYTESPGTAEALY